MEESVMPITRLLIALLLFTIPVGAPVGAQEWSEHAPIPTVRWAPASVTLDGRMYVIGGQEETPPHAALSVVEVYDPATDTWATAAPLPTSRWGAMVAVGDDGRIYVIGGCTGDISSFTTTSANEVYDPATDTWSGLAPMPQDRGWGGCAALEGVIYVFGGFTREGWQTLDVVETYDPVTDSWSSESPMPLQRDTIVYATLGGLAYAMTGCTDQDPLTARVHAFDPQTGTWTRVADIPTPRNFADCAVRDGKIYVAGGRGTLGNEVEAYDPVTDTWEACTPMLLAREGVACGTLNDCVFVVAGSAPSPPGFPFYPDNHSACFGTSDSPVSSIGGAIHGVKHGVRPNPLVGRGAIIFELPASSMVDLRIYDIRGAHVRTLESGRLSAGRHTAWWDCLDRCAKAVPSGCYLYRLAVDDRHLVGKLEVCR
ncbi:MAG: hypothetical protein GF346_05750 [Candidatus Eisenbacteria bacterium]|nr:hypothetical protein [Candidatus Latescibacterota bacterium]MBD3301932.1 hypothetical protein [Candidatus Eisenbacteria bacterium]